MENIYFDPMFMIWYLRSLALPIYVRMYCTLTSLPVRETQLVVKHEKLQQT